MGQPYRGGQRPVVGQDDDTLVGVDRGDLFTQEGPRPERTAWQWEYEDGTVGSGRWVPLQPFGPHDFKRSLWDIRLRAETGQRLQLGPEWIGRRFRLQTWGGFGPTRDGGVDYVEWGNTDGSHADDLRPSERSYSDPWVVKPFGTRPPDPPLVDTEANRQDALKRLGSSIETWKRAPWYDGSDAAKKKLRRQRQTVAHRLLTLPQDADTLDTVNAVLDSFEDERA